MPHADTQIFAPVGHVESVEEVLRLSAHFACLPGRVAVLMDPVPDTFTGSLILVPEGKGLTGKFRPDAGTVISSGVGDLKRGDRVLVKPYDGLWLKNEDNAKIPAGREVRFYGIASTWWDSIPAVIEE